LCQRQEYRSRRNAFMLNDDRSVMQRRRRVEDRHQQVVAHPRIKLQACVDKIPQADIAFDDDQGASFLARQRRQGKNDLVVNAAAELPTLLLERQPQTARKIHQSLSYLGLEQDDDRKPDVNDRVPQDELKREKLLIDRDPIKYREEYKADHRRHRTRAAKELDDDIDNDKYKRNIDQIAQGCYCQNVAKLH